MLAAAALEHLVRLEHLCWTKLRVCSRASHLTQFCVLKVLLSCLVVKVLLSTCAALLLSAFRASGVDERDATRRGACR